MARHFNYPCPDCRSTNDLHDPECSFAGDEWHAIEEAYVDVIAALTAGVKREEELPRSLPEWSGLHKAVLDHLRTVQRIEERDGHRLELRSPDEYRELLTTPQHEPVKTIYDSGSVPGCHDNSVFALVAYYEMVGLSWEETREQIVNWLHDTGTWERGGFAEETPEDLVDGKRHVYEEGYGWKQAAKEAKAVIDRYH